MMPMITLNNVALAAKINFYDIYDICDFYDIYDFYENQISTLKLAGYGYREYYGVERFFYSKQ